ncbi:MAG: Trp family transcriptional regulator [Candidatus Levyibacteriota bacterium]
MRRYHFLTKEDVYESLNRLRDAFLAAKNGSEVENIINAILTADEKLRIGRRIIIAGLIKSGMTVEEIVRLLKVGNNTVMSVVRSIEINEQGFELLEQRRKRVEKEYQDRKYKSVGGSTKIFKSKIYTGYKRKDVKR